MGGNLKNVQKKRNKLKNRLETCFDFQKKKFAIP